MFWPCSSIKLGPVFTRVGWWERCSELRIIANVLFVMFLLTHMGFNTGINLIFLDGSCTCPVLFASVQMWPFLCLKSKNPAFPSGL